MELLEGLNQLFSFWGLIAFAAGVAIGFIIGILPGLGTGTAWMLAFPIVFLVPKEMAFICFAAMLGGCDFGASVTSIILCTPGSVSNLTTVFDGYPMAKSGQAGRALGLAAFSSIYGSVIGIIVLVLAIPVVQKILHFYGSREFFWTVVMSLLVVGLATASGAFLKGLGIGLLGILASFIGYSGFLGETRFSGESLYFWDGLDMGTFIIGIFALSELVMLQARGLSISSSDRIEQASIRQAFASGREAAGNLPQLTMGSIIGTIVGIIPGIGGSVACYLSYGAARFVSKKGHLFGKGSPEGLMASEVANNAKDGGALLTTLFFGVPGSAEMAILLGVFLVVGINPGPDLAEKNLSLVWLIILSTLLGNIVSCVMVLLGSKQLSRITSMSVTMVVAATIPISLTGLYVIGTTIWDVVFAVAFGLVGLFLKRNGYPLPPLIIGFVLGPLAEKSFHMTLQSSLHNPLGFFNSVWAMAMVVLCVVLLAAPFIYGLKAKRKAAADVDSDLPLAEAGPAPKEPVVVAGVMTLVAVAFLIGSFRYGFEGGVWPGIVASLAIIILTLVTISEANGRFALGLERAMGPFGQRGRLVKDPDWGKLAPVFLWLLAFVAVIFLIGYICATFLGVFFLLRKWGNYGKLKCAVVALALDAFIYGVYGLVFGVRLWPGIIPTIIHGFIGGGELPPI